MPDAHQQGMMMPPEDDEARDDIDDADVTFRERLEDLKRQVLEQALLQKAEKLRQDLNHDQTPNDPLPATEPPAMGTPRPYTVVGQTKLFKAGLLGSAVTIWSKVDGPGGHEREQVMHDAATPVVVSVDSEDIEKQISFAAGYVYGWVESTGGEDALTRLDIWLEPYVLGEELQD